MIYVHDANVDTDSFPQAPAGVPRPAPRPLAPAQGFAGPGSLALHPQDLSGLRPRRQAPGLDLLLHRGAVAPLHVRPQGTGPALSPGARTRPAAETGALCPGAGTAAGLSPPTGPSPVIQHSVHACRNWVEKQRQIDRLTEEVARLKARLRYQERTAKEAPFGSATPSAKQSIKASSLVENQAKRGGAKPGHPGAGARPRKRLPGGSAWPLPPAARTAAKGWWPRAPSPAPWSTRSPYNGK